MSSDEPQQFKYNITEVNPTLWSQYKDESGLVNITPYKAKLIRQKPVYMKQYPLSPEKVEDIQPVIDLFFLNKVIVLIHSPYNTPINPIRKADGTSWRLTQDLRAINSLIIPLTPIVPDVPTILISIRICVQPSSPSPSMQRHSRCLHLHLKVLTAQPSSPLR